MSLHGGTQMDSKQAARAVIFERKLLVACLWLAILSLLVWIVAISTDYWSVHPLLSLLYPILRQLFYDILYDSYSTIFSMISSLYTT